MPTSNVWKELDILWVCVCEWWRNEGMKEWRNEGMKEWRNDQMPEDANICKDVKMLNSKQQRVLQPGRRGSRYL